VYRSCSRLNTLILTNNSNIDNNAVIILSFLLDSKNWENNNWTAEQDNSLAIRSHELFEWIVRMNCSNECAERMIWFFMNYHKTFGSGLKCPVAILQKLGIQLRLKFKIINKLLSNFLFAVLSGVVLSDRSQHNVWCNRFEKANKPYNEPHNSEVLIHTRKIEHIKRWFSSNHFRSCSCFTSQTAIERLNHTSTAVWEVNSISEQINKSNLLNLIPLPDSANSPPHPPHPSDCLLQPFRCIRRRPWTPCPW